MPKKTKEDEELQEEISQQSESYFQTDEMSDLED
jgi:hypothetical protein